eukprot:10286150-Ditylum_brightwellii.AAC.1
MAVMAMTRKTSFLLPQPPPPKGRNLGCQWQPMTHPVVMPSHLPHLLHHLCSQNGTRDGIL